MYVVCFTLVMATYCDSLLPWTTRHLQTHNRKQAFGPIFTHWPRTGQLAENLEVAAQFRETHLDPKRPIFRQTVSNGSIRFWVPVHFARRWNRVDSAACRFPVTTNVIPEFQHGELGSEQRVLKEPAAARSISFTIHFLIAAAGPATKDREHGEPEIHHRNSSAARREAGRACPSP
jgi:hypothetical protein